MKERILCSAIWYKELPTQHYLPKNIAQGVVVCGLRHAHCIYVTLALSKLRTVTFAEDGVGEHIQGFLTNKNRFVDRIEGAEIAFAAGQIEELKYSDKELYSEDLY